MYTETFYEKLERQHEVLEQLRADNKQLTDSATVMLDLVDDLKEEVARLKDIIQRIAEEAP